MRVCAIARGVGAGRTLLEDQATDSRSGRIAAKVGGSCRMSATLPLETIPGLTSSSWFRFSGPSQVTGLSAPILARAVSVRAADEAQP